MDVMCFKLLFFPLRHVFTNQCHQNALVVSYFFSLRVHLINMVPHWVVTEIHILCLLFWRKLCKQYKRKDEETSKWVLHLIPPSHTLPPSFYVPYIPDHTLPPSFYVPYTPVQLITQCLWSRFIHDKAMLIPSVCMLTFSLEYPFLTNTL